MKLRESIEKENFTDLCIYTSTQYGDDDVSKIRYPLALKTLKKCQELGLQIIIGDSSTNKDFLKELEKIKNIILIKTDSSLKSGAKRRIILQEGIDQFDKSKYFLRLEPEKYDLIKEESLLKMLKELRENHANIIIPHRNNIDQMPELFAWIEKRAIKKVNEEIMKSPEEYDLWFGPRMFDREGAKYFLEYNKDGDRTDLGDSLITPTIQAYNNGLSLRSVDVDFSYDPLEVKIEQSRELRNKRVSQYDFLIGEIKKELINIVS